MCCGSISGAPQIHFPFVDKNSRIAVVRSQAPLRYIMYAARLPELSLWFDLRRPSDTFDAASVSAAVCCGSISGAPQIHWTCTRQIRRQAVVRSQAPLRYIGHFGSSSVVIAVVRSQAPLRYIRPRQSGASCCAVVRSQAPLRYIDGYCDKKRWQAVVRSQAPLRYIHGRKSGKAKVLWFDLRRPSDTFDVPGLD